MSGGPSRKDIVMKQITSVIACLLLTASARAAVHTEVVTYKDGDVVLEGYLAYVDRPILSPQPTAAEAAMNRKRPGILVVHEWLGLNEHARKRAEMLAEQGFVAFACDMYGKGVRAAGPQDGPRLSAPFKDDRKLMRSRALAGLEVLRKHAFVDPNKLAAIGFCFGGTTSLELARAGTDLRGVVAFHAGLVTSIPAQPGQVKAKVLVCQGGDDPHVPPPEVIAFEDEMRKAAADWQVIAYGGAVHSFTNPAAKDPANGVAYNAEADRRSWQAMKDFFAEVFAK
jgi:dienelactone hydrolase